MNKTTEQNKDDGWLPIEDAPTDGRNVLGCIYKQTKKLRGTTHIMSSYVDHWHGTCWSKTDGYQFVGVTHWKPL